MGKYNEKNIAIKRIKNIDNEIFNEIMILSDLNHPNLLKLYGFYTENNDLFIISDYYKNNSLKDNFHLLTDYQKLKFSFDIISGLYELNINKNIYHRDIKCENILLDLNNNRSIIIDFGTSKIISDLGASLTETLNISGSATHMCPEMFENKFNNTVDIYSFGCVLYELIFHIQPYLLEAKKSNINDLKSFFDIKKKSPPTLNLNDSKIQNINIFNFFKQIIEKTIINEFIERISLSQIIDLYKNFFKNLKNYFYNGFNSEIICLNSNCVLYNIEHIFHSPNFLEFYFSNDLKLTCFFCSNKNAKILKTYFKNCVLKFNNLLEKSEIQRFINLTIFDLKNYSNNNLKIILF